jgi:carbonic anhydrase/acetyltransferase-like protein (isoleucine patch superfamily)
MPLFSFEGKSPRIHPTAFIAPTASIIGDVTVEENASFGTFHRDPADFSPIVIQRRERTDCAVIHVTPSRADPGATVGHLCPCTATLGEECLIGNSSTVLTGQDVAP